MDILSNLHTFPPQKTIPSKYNYCLKIILTILGPFLKFIMPWAFNGVSASKVKTSRHCRGGSIAASSQWPTGSTWIVGLQLILGFPTPKKKGFSHFVFFFLYLR